MTRPERLYSATRPDPAAAPPLALAATEDPTEDRRLMAVDALLLLHQQTKHPITLSDLSRHGCCIENAPLSLRPGQFISIKLARLDYLQAIVRWNEDGRAGVEFTQALHQAVFDYQVRHMLPE